MADDIQGLLTLSKPLRTSDAMSSFSLSPYSPSIGMSF